MKISEGRACMLIYFYICSPVVDHRHIVELHFSLHWRENLSCCWLKFNWTRCSQEWRPQHVRKTFFSPTRANWQSFIYSSTVYFILSVILVVSCCSTMVKWRCLHVHFNLHRTIFMHLNRRSKKLLNQHNSVFFLSFICEDLVNFLNLPQTETLVHHIEHFSFNRLKPWLFKDICRHRAAKHLYNFTSNTLQGSPRSLWVCCFLLLPLWICLFTFARLQWWRSLSPVVLYKPHCTNKAILRS